MGTQRHSPSWRGPPLLFLLLGLVVPLATAQAFSYREAVLRTVEGFNQQSSEPNLYRLLQLDPLPKDDEDQGAVKPVSFTLKETVCPRTSQQPPEQCDFKENGLVKQCLGTIILDPDEGYFDISCDEPLRTKRFRKLGNLLQKGGQKIGQKIERIGQKIKDFFSNLVPRQEGA
ncbi:cathelicidin antimicrobial peptide isoform X1 [Manis javanica]|uniref:cathelicidin antimicrobial peptide isoform X1 n=1 Tax=Manis javanica TaxID=9974 RepID=UPI003C6D3C1B|nr:Cathelicidin antimicrobial peptide [Manis javanica]